MNSQDDTTPTVPPPLFNWAVHRRAIALSALASWMILGAVFGLRTGTVPELILTACGVQLLAMSAVLPIAAAGGRRPIEILSRGGAFNDAFGIGLLAAALLTAQITWIEALKVYLLVGTVGLVCLGVFCWVRGAGRRPSSAVLITTGVGIALWAGPFTATGMWFHPSSVVGQPVTVRVIANADLHAALSACVGLAEGPVPWYGVLMVYAAVAGMVWSAPLVMTGGAVPKDQRDPADQA